MRHRLKKTQLELINILFDNWLDYLDRHRLQGRIWIVIMSMSIGVSIMIFSALLGYYTGQQLMNCTFR